MISERSKFALIPCANSKYIFVSSNKTTQYVIYVHQKQPMKRKFRTINFLNCNEEIKEKSQFKNKKIGQLGDYLNVAYHSAYK